MNLHFESLDELHDMIREMGYVKPVEPVFHVSVPHMSSTEVAEWAKKFKAATAGPSGETASDEGEEGNVQAPAGELAAGANPSQATRETDSNGSQVFSPEPAKRKRRTKAEMEAARAADATVTEVSQGAPLTNTAQPAHAANPFEASTSNPSTATQAILSAPSGQAATLAGIQAMQTSPFDTTATTPQDGAQSADVAIASTSPVDTATFIETRSLEILSTQTEPLTAVKHMHLCRDFIAKHGQAKYLEGFALAGLPATIGTYKPEQCARHQAALEFLNLNA